MSRLPPSPPAAGAQRDQAPPRPPSLRRHPYRYSTEFPVLTDRIAVDGTQWCEEISDHRCRLHVHVTINVQLRGLGPQVSPAPHAHPPAPVAPARTRLHPSAPAPPSGRRRRRVDEPAGAAQIEKQIEKGVRSAYAELPERACDYLLHQVDPTPNPSPNPNPNLTPNPNPNLLHQGDTTRMDAAATPATSSLHASLLGDADSQARPRLLPQGCAFAPPSLAARRPALAPSPPHARTTRRKHRAWLCAPAASCSHPAPATSTHFHPATRPRRRRHPPPRV